MKTRSMKVKRGIRLPFGGGGQCCAVMMYRKAPIDERCPIVATQQVQTLPNGKRSAELVPLCYTHAGRSQVDGEILIDASEVLHVA